MATSMGQNTLLTVGFCLLLSLLGCQRCTAFPAAAELPADPWAHGAGANLEAPKTDEENGNNGEGMFGEDIFTGDTNADDPDWGSYADLQQVDGGSLGHYDAMDWGSFFIPASSSDEAEYDHGDYDPLGGGMFTSDIIDPSISHSLFGGSTPNQEDVSQTGGHNSNTNVQRLPTKGLGLDTSQNSFGTNGIEQGGVGLLPETEPGTPEAGGEGDRETNAIDETYHPEAQPIQDAPLGNVLSPVLAKGDDIPAVPQEADISVGLNGIGVQARHGAAGRFTDEKVEKPAGRPLDGAVDVKRHTPGTGGGDSVHSLLTQIVVLVNRLIEAQGKPAAS